MPPFFVTEQSPTIRAIDKQAHDPYQGTPSGVPTDAGFTTRLQPLGLKPINVLPFCGIAEAMP